MSGEPYYPPCPECGHTSHGGPCIAPRVAKETNKDEILRLNRATNDTLGPNALMSFQNTPAGKQAAYLIRRWRELAMKYFRE